MSFAACFIAVIAAYAIKGNIESNRYKSRLEAVYQQNLNELAGTLDEIETSLQKSEYACSGNMMNSLSSDLYPNATRQKALLRRCPLTSLT